MSRSSAKVHRYYLPRIRSADRREVDSWSVWLVDEDTGTLVIFGDRGTWSHTWGRAGRCEAGRNDFRRELLSFGADYLENKLSVGCARTYDEAATQKNLEKHLGSLEFEDTPCRAAEILDEFERLDFHDFVEQFPEYDFVYTETVHEWRWLKHLVVVTLPRFKAAVRTELFREASHRWFQRQEAA